MSGEKKGGHHAAGPARRNIPFMPPDVFDIPPMP
jgi:hypothetical protein